MTVPSTAPSADIRTISLIGLAHGTSHFFHLLLPPLFPFFMQDFGLSFSELGLLTTVFFVVSGIGQALSGFLVDRYGATRLLYFGLSAFAVAALLVSRAQGYVGLIAGAAALGMGNAVFHPVDYTILNRRVSAPRLGHAYSTHGITGNLGWALAPVFLVGIASASSWRVAALCAAALAIAVLALMLWRREELEVAPAWNAKPSKHEAPAEHALAFMKLPVVWLCFGFFFTSAMALGAIQNFSVPALKQLYALPLEQATFALSAYLVCGALGMAVGGFVATKTKHSHMVIALGMGIGVLLLGLLGLQLITPAYAPLLMIVSGFSIGIAGPSRDLLIKKATPVGSTGRVYGTVYSGLDVGLAMSPLILGVALDAGKPQAVFLLAALALMGAIGFALAVSQRRATSSAAPATGLSKA
jgi:MFS transporter, FSR family, fosmidomycin resistance protein